ncbi:hypothetical protein EYF80_057686 [Liparis tanakae]|uniref:Uncharacterized protein n=1 Tax=Liparis tanakae TaxID=230148 RepID=A0A4Z2EUB0_9TELE|nr:hypothetical protein EYF80_057686 [Liparis tanakae]
MGTRDPQTLDPQTLRPPDPQAPGPQTLDPQTPGPSDPWTLRPLDPQTLRPWSLRECRCSRAVGRCVREPRTQKIMDEGVRRGHILCPQLRTEDVSSVLSSVFQSNRLSADNKNIKS